MTRMAAATCAQAASTLPAELKAERSVACYAASTCSLTQSLELILTHFWRGDHHSLSQPLCLTNLLVRLTSDCLLLLTSPQWVKLCSDTCSRCACLHSPLTAHVFNGSRSDCHRSGGRFIEPAGHHRLRFTITNAGNSSINKDPITEQLTDFHHHHQLLSDHNHISAV